MPDVQEMTERELERMNGLNTRKMAWARHRTDGWKARIEGEWHYGFVSEEQALVAAGFFYEPMVGTYVKITDNRRTT